MLPHSVGDVARMRRSENDVVAEMMKSEKRPGHSAGNKNQEKSKREFPFQRAVHCENSVWIAESAIAYSFVAVLADFVSSRYFREAAAPARTSTPPAITPARPKKRQNTATYVAPFLFA